MKRLIAVSLASIILLSACGKNIGEPPVVVESGAAQSNVTEQSLPEGKQSLYVKNLASELSKELKLSEMPETQAVQAIYEYMVGSIFFADPVGLDTWRYVENSEEPISYMENRSLSPLLFKIGSCEDFATTTVMLLESVGIPAKYVAGFTYSKEGSYIDHAWSMVQLEGNWYHLDPQLEQNIVRDSKLTYKYFLRSDNEFVLDHRWSENLIEFWPDMREEEKAIIRAEYTYPQCSESIERPIEKEMILPERPNLVEVEQQINKIKQASGLAKLSNMTLNVEPPILVREYHVTPPLFTKANSTLIFRYGREELEPVEQVFYDKLANACASGKELPEVKVPLSVTVEQAEKVVSTFLDDYPEYYWVGFSLKQAKGQYVAAMSYINSLTWNEIEGKNTRLYQKTEKLLAQTSGLSDYETALYIHDYLTENINYDHSAVYFDSVNIYGTLVDTLAFCNGFARSFQFLASQCGIDTVYIKGTNLAGTPHAWNAVRLSEEWYYVDVTWDRARRKTDTSLRDFFAITKEEISYERVPEKGQYESLPEASSTEMNFFKMEDYAVVPSEIANENESIKIFADMFYRQLKTKEITSTNTELAFLQVRVFGSDEDYEKWKDIFVKQIFEILQEMERMAREENLNIKVQADEKVQCRFNDKMKVFTMYPRVNVIVTDK